MPFFGMGNKSSTKDILVVDIGSGSVGAALAMLDKNGPPALRTQTRIEEPVGAAPDQGALAQQLLRAAEEALQHVLGNPNASVAPTAITEPHDAAPLPVPKPKAFVLGPQAKNISHVAIFLPAPWSALALRAVRFAPPQPVKVSPDVIERLIAESKEQETAAAGQEIIERSALGLRLNGYAVEEIPKGTSVTTIDLTVITATASSQLLSALRDMVRNYLGHTATISFHSTSVSLSYGLFVLKPHEGNYLLCNSEGEVTELLLVSEHTPRGVSTAPQGCSAILRTLNTHADMARAEGASALALAREKESPMQQKLAETLAAAQKTCAEGFEQAATQLLKNFNAPAKIYILGSGAESLWYADAIAAAPFLKALFPQGVQVENVRYNDIAAFLNTTGRENLPAITETTASIATSRTNGEDLYLALEAMFCDARFDRDRTFNFSLK